MLLAAPISAGRPIQPPFISDLPDAAQTRLWNLRGTPQLPLCSELVSGAWRRQPRGPARSIPLHRIGGGTRAARLGAALARPVAQGDSP